LKRRSGVHTSEGIESPVLGTPVPSYTRRTPIMDITTLAAWGEFLGGIAVVVSLIYLAGQIRQNSKLLHVSTTVALGESDIELARMPVEDSEVWRILQDGYEGH